MKVQHPSTRSDVRREGLKGKGSRSGGGGDG